MSPSGKATFSTPLASRVVGVSADTAGYEELPEAELARALGKNAWRVLLALWDRRDREGLTHVTITGIGYANGYRELHEKAVKRALARLNSSGIVANLGWRFVSVPVSYGRKAKRRVFCRRVFGARLLGSPAEISVCSVPRDVKEWVQNATYQGGSRPGAGRRKDISRAPQTRSETPEEVYIPSVSGLFKVSPWNSNCPLGQRIKVSPLIYVVQKRRRKDHRMNLSPTEREAPAVRAHPVSSSNPDEGESFGGQATSAPFSPSTPLSGIPPFPGASIVIPARVPEPPKLAECKNESSRVRMVILAFRAAMKKQLRSKGKSFAFENISPKSKYWKWFASAAELLHAFDVSPYAWCLWKVRQWYNIKTHEKDYDPKKPVRPPPLAFVFNERTITERIGEERKRTVVKESALGGRVIFGPRHKSLVRRYSDMRAAILAGMSKAAAVQKYFPNASYDDMLDAAKLEALETRVRLEQRIARGEFVW